MWRALGVAAAIAVAAGCGSTRNAQWEHDRAVASRTIELQVDKGGKYREIEYHIPPDRVPAAVRNAMDRLHPGTAFDDAEMEWNDGRLYYELARKVDGMDVEAMFFADGTLHEEEIQVAMAKVPEVVRNRAIATAAGGQVTKWEEIRNGNREPIAYHVKMTRGRDKYKMMFRPDGTPEGMVREVPAEIEVPAE